MKTERTNLIEVEETVLARGVYVSFFLTEFLDVMLLLATDEHPFRHLRSNMTRLPPPLLLPPPPLLDSPQRTTMTRKQPSLNI
jgi:hypothetical protein